MTYSMSAEMLKSSKLAVMWDVSGSAAAADAESRLLSLDCNPRACARALVDLHVRLVLVESAVRIRLLQ